MPLSHPHPRPLALTPFTGLVPFPSSAHIRRLPICLAIFLAHLCPSPCFDIPYSLSANYDHPCPSKTHTGVSQAFLPLVVVMVRRKAERTEHEQVPMRMGNRRCLRWCSYFSLGCCWYVLYHIVMREQFTTVTVESFDARMFYFPAGFHFDYLDEKLRCMRLHPSYSLIYLYSCRSSAP